MVEKDPEQWFLKDSDCCDDWNSFRIIVTKIVTVVKIKIPILLNLL